MHACKHTKGFCLMPPRPGICGPISLDEAAAGTAAGSYTYFWGLAEKPPFRFGSAVGPLATCTNCGAKGPQVQCMQRHNCATRERQSKGCVTLTCRRDGWTFGSVVAVVGRACHAGGWEYNAEGAPSVECEAHAYMGRAKGRHARESHTLGRGGIRGRYKIVRVI